MMNDEEPAESDEDKKNDQWLKENYMDLIQDYPNHWIAVADQQVISKGNSKRAVEAEAKRLAPGKSVSLYFIEPSDIMP
jgi:hypothetical protein